MQYGYNGRIGLPSSAEEIKKDILKFKFKDGIGDWAYPNCLDMAIFKKSKISNFYVNAGYSSPNTLESAWAGVADLNKFGLCFRLSKKFVLPLNIVQEDWWVPNENSFSAEELFQKWKEGLKINISEFYRINNNCALMGYAPNFIPRNP